MAAEQDLFFDWNAAHAGPDRLGEALVLDETLRDGIQSPSAVDPRIEEKIEILHLLDELGVAQLDVGLPGAGPHQRAAVKRLAEEKRDARLGIRLNVACRTVTADIAPAAEVQQETGVPLEVYAFIGSSPIRQYAEEWDLSFIEKQSVEAISFAVAQGLSVTYVTEDTTRSKPGDLRRRVGSTACDQLLVNLKLMGHPIYGPRDMSKLVRFVQLSAKVTGHQLPVNYPVAGPDAFRTATGVHAAAIIKAQRKGDHWLADRIYSGVPAGEFGKEQEIEIGPLSGLSNVKHWLARHEIPADEPLAKAVLARAKASNRTLTESEVAQIVREVRS